MFLAAYIKYIHDRVSKSVIKPRIAEMANINPAHILCKQNLNYLTHKYIFSTCKIAYSGCFCN